MNYDNMIKLLMFSLLGSQKVEDDERPVCLNFLDMAERIEKRYEAVNDELNGISVEKVWGDSTQLNHFFKAKTGIVFKKDASHKILTIDFVDKTNIAQKTSYMETITDVEQLKNYFHYSLRSLRKSPFYTEDYELELEKAFEDRLREIIDLILDQTKKQLELLKDFREIHGVVTDLMERSWDKGFTEDQRHRLNDIYELRIDELKREKLDEVDHFVETIREHHELKDYWNSIKWYLLDNRQFLGKEYEGLIARKFDEAVKQTETAEMFG